MDNKESKYIDSIDIKGLWNRFDISWQLDKDVNILIGENGTGKSTILRAVVELFESLNDVSKGLKIHQNDKIKELNVSFSHQEKKIDFIITNNDYGPVFNIYNGKDEQLDYNNSIPLSEKRKEACEVFYKTFKPYYITTFDVKNTLGENLLDEAINALEKDFIAYRFKKLRSLSQNKDALKGETFFYETINRLFEITGKQLDKNDEKLSFIINRNEKLHWNELSSGEKQLLIILLTILCQDENPSVLMMDEPEISLHLLWQYELIEIIKTLNPNCQLLIVTHSPSIFGMGWRDKVTFVRDIKKVVKNTNDGLPF